MKKGILIVSFGTTYHETREKNIEKIAEAVRDQNPDCEVCQAYSSKMVRAILKKRDGIEIPGIEEALEEMKIKGITHLTVLPTHIIDGVENNKMKQMAKKSEAFFDEIKVACALLEREEDYSLTAKAFWDEIKEDAPEGVVVLMGHGSYHEADIAYKKFEEALREYAGREIYIATVEGATSIEDVIKKMNASVQEKSKRMEISVLIAPLMLVAGDHAVNDMSGEEVSFLTKLRAEGYNVKCLLKGLGEYKGIREIYLKYLQGASRLLTLFLCVFLLSGCGLGKAEQVQTEKVLQVNTEAIAEEQTEFVERQVHFTDSLDREVTVELPERVAVLSGSYADAWLLAGGKLFATTEDAKETVTLMEETKMLGSLKSPSIETMIEEGVDFLILSSAIEEHVRLCDTLEAAGITTAYFEVESFNDYADMMKVMTDITGRKDLYEKNVEMIRLEIEYQMERADGSRPSVLFLRAYSTGVKAKGSDSMTGQMFEKLDCINIADHEDGLLEDLSMEAIIHADPDYIFVTTMGESEEAAMNMVEELLTTNPAWNGLKAVQGGHYYVLPKELFHNKPNERWGESYRILAGYLYGEE